MNLSRFEREPTSKVLRQFAAAWAVFFSIVAIRQYVARHNNTLAIAIAGIGLGPGVFGLLYPRGVKKLYLVATFVTAPIGWVVSTIALAVLFFGVVTPLAIFFRMRGRDILQLKLHPNQSTFWKPKKTVEDVTRYFRQY